MKATVEPGFISGTITAPPSKSLSQRAMAAALLHKGVTTIRNAGYSADEHAALEIIQQLGARVTEEKQENGLRKVIVTSNGVHPIANEINCGESGLAARLFTPIAALYNGTITINGHGSLLQRPMEGMGAALSALAVKTEGFTGFVPFTINGPIQPKSIKIDAGGSSQLLSGLLFALSACATEPITIEVSKLESRPYIDMTLDVLAQFGKPIKNLYYKRFLIDPILFTHTETREITIEADWSSAAFLLVAGAIAGDVTVPNLDVNSLQADRAIIDVLQQARADMVMYGSNITTKKSRMKAFDFDATHCPDLFPALAALAAFCDGDSRIKGVHRLFHKESNRVESITEMLWCYGVHFSVEDDTLCIEGIGRLQGTIIDTYNDHRIVMAAAICALRAKSPIDIMGAEAVKKSYPGFFEDLMGSGIRCWFV